MTPSIRAAGVGDAETISRIYAESWKAAYQGIVPQAYLDGLSDQWVVPFTTWLSGKTLTARLAFDGATPVGCIAYGRSRDPALPDWGEIVSLYLVPRVFGHGFGAALLRTALADLSEQGFREAFLWVMRDNVRARAFYEKAGFSRVGNEVGFEIMGKQLFELRYDIDLSGKKKRPG